MTEPLLNDQENTALAILKSKPEGYLQSDLWKELGVNSRVCSRILKKLESAKYITRTSCTRDGARTFLVQIVPKAVVVDPMLLMAGETIVPCVACEEECDIEHCKMLEDWMYELVFAEMD